MKAVLNAAAKKSGWPKPSAPGRALGIACGTEKGSYVAAAAELSKAPTGFTIERLIVVFECGAIVNPDGLLNQVEGAVVQGLGGALFESVDFRNGEIVNGSLERVPGAALQGHPAYRNGAPRSERPAVRRRRRNADRLRGPRHRQRGAVVRHGGARAPGYHHLRCFSALLARSR